DRSESPTANYSIDPTAGIAEVRLAPSEREFIKHISNEPLCLVLSGTTDVERLIAKGSPVYEVTLVISLGVSRVAHRFAPRVVSLELQTLGKPSPELNLHRVVVRERIIRQTSGKGRIGIRDEKVHRQGSFTIGPVKAVERKRARHSSNIVIIEVADK